MIYMYKILLRILEIQEKMESGIVYYSTQQSFFSSGFSISLLNSSSFQGTINSKD